MTNPYNIFSYIDLPGLYLSNPLLWDALIYLLIFLGLSQFVFRKVYEQRYGKIVGVGVGLLLTISMVLFEFYTGLYIGSYELALLPVIVIHSLMMYLVYQLFHELFEMPLICAIALAYLITYAGLTAMFHDPYSQLGFYNDLFETFLIILNLVAIVTLIICVTRLFQGFSSGGQHSHGPHGTHDHHGDTFPPRYGDRDHHDYPGGRRGHGDPHNLFVDLTHPRNGQRFSQGQSIPVVGHISGGSGRYEWVVSIDGHAQYQGRRPQINVSLSQHDIHDRLEPGNHIVQVYVRDRRQNLQETIEREIVISGRGYHGHHGGGHGPGRILGIASWNDGSDPRNLADAEYHLWTRDENGLEEVHPQSPVRGTYQPGGRRTLFSFDDLAPGQYIIRGEHDGCEGVCQQGEITLTDDRPGAQVDVVFTPHQHTGIIAGSVFAGPAFNDDQLRKFAQGAEVTLYSVDDQENDIAPVGRIIANDAQAKFRFENLDPALRYRIACRYRPPNSNRTYENILLRNPNEQPFQLQNGRREGVRVHVLIDPFVQITELEIPNRGRVSHRRASQIHDVPQNAQVGVQAVAWGFPDGTEPEWILQFPDNSVQALNNENEGAFLTTDTVPLINLGLHAVICLMDRENQIQATAQLRVLGQGTQSGGTPFNVQRGDQVPENLGPRTVWIRRLVLAGPDGGWNGGTIRVTEDRQVVQVPAGTPVAAVAAYAGFARDSGSSWTLNGVEFSNDAARDHSEHNNSGTSTTLLSALLPGRHELQCTIDGVPSNTVIIEIQKSNSSGRYGGNGGQSLADRLENSGLPEEDQNREPPPSSSNPDSPSSPNTITISGTAIRQSDDETINPVPEGMRIHFIDTSNEAGDDGDSQAVVGSSGRFVTRVDPRKRYYIDVHDPSYPKSQVIAKIGDRSVVVFDGGYPNDEFVLEIPGSDIVIDFEVVIASEDVAKTIEGVAFHGPKENKQPASDLVIRALAEDGSAVPAQLGGGGRFVIRGLDPEKKYRLDIYSTKYPSAVITGTPSEGPKFVLFDGSNSRMKFAHVKKNEQLLIEVDVPVEVTIAVLPPATRDRMYLGSVLMATVSGASNKAILVWEHAPATSANTPATSGFTAFAGVTDTTVTINDLPIGLHTIRATAVDGDKQSAPATININVFEPIVINGIHKVGGGLLTNIAPGDRLIVDLIEQPGLLNRSNKRVNWYYASYNDAPPDDKDFIAFGADSPSDLVVQIPDGFSPGQYYIRAQVTTDTFTSEPVNQLITVRSAPANAAKPVEEDQYGATTMQIVFPAGSSANHIPVGETLRAVVTQPALQQGVTDRDITNDVSIYWQYALAGSIDEDATYEDLKAFADDPSDATVQLNLDPGKYLIQARAVQDNEEISTTTAFVDLVSLEQARREQKAEIRDSVSSFINDDGES